MDITIDSDYLLNNRYGKILFHDYVEQEQVYDFHTHLSSIDIVQNCKYENLADLWLKNDHFKWRVMRNAGIAEKYITGDASDKDKFVYFAKALYTAVGSPLFYWCNLELKDYFNISQFLTTANAEYIWDLSKERINDFRINDILNKSNIKTLFIAEDPINDISHYNLLYKESKITIAPLWRSDGLFFVDNTNFINYLNSLSEITSVNIIDIDSLRNAIKTRMNMFEKIGCKSIDVALDNLFIKDYVNNEANDDQLNQIINKRRKALYSDIELFRYYIFNSQFEGHHHLHVIL